MGLSGVDVNSGVTITSPQSGIPYIGIGCVNNNTNYRLMVSGNTNIIGNTDFNGTTSINGDLIVGNIENSGTTTGNIIRFHGVTGDYDTNYNHTVIAERLYNGTTADKSELLLFKGNDSADVDKLDRIRLDATGEIIFQNIHEEEGL